MLPSQRNFTGQLVIVFCIKTQQNTAKHNQSIKINILIYKDIIYCLLIDNIFPINSDTVAINACYMQL